MELCSNIVNQFIMNSMRDLQPVPILYIQDLKSLTSVQSDVQEFYVSYTKECMGHQVHCSRAGHV